MATMSKNNQARWEMNKPLWTEKDFFMSTLFGWLIGQMTDEELQWVVGNICMIPRFDRALYKNGYKTGGE